LLSRDSDYMEQQNTIRYKLRLRVEKIERSRKTAGLTQEEFAERCGTFGVSWYREVLRETRAGRSPNVTLEFVAGVLSALGWTLDQVVEQIASKPA